MKTTLEFQDDEIELATMAFNGAEAFSALHAIDSWCRNRAKYHEISEETEKALDIVRDMTRLELNCD